MAQRVVIDSDILSAILRGNSSVLEKARDYLAEHGQFDISIISQYEILRGLKAKQATSQLARFNTFCERNRIIPVSQAVVVRASDIYAVLRGQGEIIGDADILIAASALSQELGVVTNNESHFKRIPGLHIANWLT